MDMKTSFATQSYAQARTATAPQATEAGPGQSPLGTIASSFAEALQNGEETARAAMLGGAVPHTLVQALAQYQLAIETAVTVRDKVVEAYQEILRMPV